jgi:hypothetical protein
LTVDRRPLNLMAARNSREGPQEKREIYRQKKKKGK